MDTPIQDEGSTPVQEDVLAESVQSNVVMPAKDCMLDEVDDNISIASSSQEKWWVANFLPKPCGHHQMSPLVMLHPLMWFPTIIHI